MRTGAIFARGSCRALKWMAVAGVVFALLAVSSGTALAQQTLTDVRATISGPRTVDEGGEATFTVRVAGTLGGRTEADPPTRSGTDRTVVVIVDIATSDQEAATTGEIDETGQPNDGAIVTNTRLSLTLDPNTGTTERGRVATGEVTFRSNTDNDAEDEVLFLRINTVTLPTGATAATAGDGVGNTARFTIEDAQEQTYELSLNTVTHTGTNPPKEATDIAVNLKAVPPHHDDGATLTLYVDGEDGKAAQGYSALGAGSTEGSSMAAIGTQNPDTAADALAEALNTRAITISQEHSDANGDGNRVTDTIVLKAFTGTGRNSQQADTVSIEVRDEHGLPAADAITAMAMNEDGEEVDEIAEGGDPVFLTVTVDRGRGTFITDEELEVEIRPADPTQVTDYDLMGGRFTLEERQSGKQMNASDDEVELSARHDDDVGAEDLVLNLVVSGGDSGKGRETSIGTFSIPIMDMTMPLVSVKDDAYDAIMAQRGEDDEPLNPGDSFSVMTDDLFEYDPMVVSVAFGISVEGPSVTASASGEAVMVTAVAAGTSKVTVTANATSKSDGLVVSQTRADLAQLMFPVSVELEALMLKLSAAEDDMNLVEGGDGGMVMVTANRAVEADTEVKVMRDRAMSSAGEDDYTLDPMTITIMAGETMGSAMVMAVEDDMMENADNMPEELVLYGMADDMEVEGTAKFYLWDAAVPALPVIAQLLLAALLGLGGYRRYLRRR